MSEKDDRPHNEATGGIVIEISSDAMEAYLVYDGRSGSEALSPSAIEKALADKGITYGIKKDVIDGIEKATPRDGRILIAEGLLPFKGSDGKIDYNHEKDNITKIKKDDIIGTLVPREEGRDGVTVFDRKIPVHPTEAVKQPTLENVSFHEDDNSFVAETDGYLHIDSSVMAVQPFFTLETTDNCMEATVTVARLNDENDFSADDLKAFLAGKGITHGVLDHEIAGIFNNKRFEISVPVAVGKDVVHGRDGSIRYYFDTEIRPERDEHGNIDYKELNIIRNVEPDDSLAEIIPAVPGDDGYTVFGEVIKAREGVTPLLPVGKNTRPNPENAGILLSNIEGAVKLSGNKVEVDPVFTTRGDVDYSTGNISFIGSVVVNGDVKSGFKIMAKGDIQISGVVEDAVIESEGNVVVRMGFIGKGHGIIIAGGDVHVAFCENERIVSKGDIFVNVYAINSNLQTRGTLHAAEKQGLIVGGESFAMKEIEANIVGSRHGTPTRLTAGIDMVTQTLLGKTGEQIEQTEKLLLKHQHRQLFKKNIPPIVNDLVKKLQKVKETKENEKKELLETLQQNDTQSDSRKKGKITIQDVVHPGTTIAIGNDQITVNDALKEVYYFHTNEGVTALPINID